MHADHRLPYPGDHGIQFEVIDSEEARQQLQKVRVVKKPRARPNELDRRIAAVLDLIRFADIKERRQFTLVALNADEFHQLPCAHQQLIVEAEQRKAHETKQPEEAKTHIKASR